MRLIWLILRANLWFIRLGDTQSKLWVQLAEFEPTFTWVLVEVDAGQIRLGIGVRPVFPVSHLLRPQPHIAGEPGIAIFQRRHLHGSFPQLAPVNQAKNSAGFLPVDSVVKP
jgi:hypothetical protein